jgi:glycosyltransferase involved in cell wall biosynthesis
VRVTVIVCTYGGQEKLVERCVGSLERQTRLPDEVLLVVDTAEEQKIYSHLLCDRVRVPLEVVSSGKRGLAAARNRGEEAATGDIIAFIDDDAEAEEHWLAEIVHTFEGSEVTVVGGPVKPLFSGKPRASKFNWVFDCTSTNPPPSRPIGCNMAFHRSVFETVGGFNEDLGMVRGKVAVGEETDLFLRMKKRYGRDAGIVLNANAIVYHRVPEERTRLRYMLKRAYAEGLAKAGLGKEHDLEVERAYLGYCLKHLDLATLLLLLAAGVGYIQGKLKHEDRTGVP